MPIASDTLGDVKRFVSLVLALASLLPLAATAQGLPGGRPPDAIDRARGLATQPFTTLPAPERPVDRYVPPQRVYSPSLGREVVVPPHYERRDGPPPVVTTPEGRNPTILPNGSLPRVDGSGGP